MKTTAMATAAMVMRLFMVPLPSKRLAKDEEADDEDDDDENVEAKLWSKLLKESVGKDRKGTVKVNPSYSFG